MKKQTLPKEQPAALRRKRLNKGTKQVKALSDSPTPKHFAHLRDKFVTIVAFGDSNTAVNHTTHGGLNWSGYLWMGLYDIFPKGYTIINSGISGDSVTKALKRLDRDVLRFDPDIVIIGFGGNDVNNSTPEKFRAELSEVIHRIREHGPCSIVLRTPNPRINLWNGQELTETPENGNPHGKLVKRDFEAFIKVICKLAKQEKTLLVDHYSMWKESMKSSCVGDLIMLMHDHVHPNTLGHRRLYHELAPIFNASRNFFYEWERILRDQKKLP